VDRSAQVRKLCDDAAPAFVRGSGRDVWARPVLTEGTVLNVSERRMAQSGRTTLIKVERGHGHRLPKLLEDVIDLTDA
jgi:hypothetical protein